MIVRRSGRWAALFSLAMVLGCRNAAQERTASGVPPTPVIRFTDGTDAAGLAFRQRHGGCGRAYFVEQTGAGVAVFDMDGDGDLDLFFPQPTALPGCTPAEALRNRLYRNDGKGHFERVPGAGGAVCSDYGIGASVGDYDGDGRLDLFESCYGRSHLFHNEGGGRFRDVTDAARLNRRGYSTSATWLDFDKDGHQDLFVCGYVEWQPDTPIRCPAPDGKLDYCTPQAFVPGKNALYRNLGNGTFADVTSTSGLAEEHDRALGVLAADLDADGWIDLFISNDNGANMLFRNQRTGRFKNEAMVRGVAFGAVGKAQSNMGIAAGDYDRDGDLDVLVTTFADEPFTLYRNEGSFFKDVSAECGLAQATYVPLGFGTCFFDADNNGWLDLFFANGHVEQFINQRSHTQTFAQLNQLFHYDGKAAFTQVTGALPADDRRVHRSAATGDLDGDGDLDLLVTALDDRPTLLRNDSPAAHWLAVDLTDARNGGACIGAKVSATADGVTQTGWVLGGGSYLCQSDFAVHFGLGTATRVSRLEISWPDGSRQVLTDVPADQRLRVRAEHRRPPG